MSFFTSRDRGYKGYDYYWQVVRIEVNGELLLLCLNAIRRLVSSATPLISDCCSGFLNQDIRRHQDIPCHTPFLVELVALETVVVNPSLNMPKHYSFFTAYHISHQFLIGTFHSFPNNFSFSILKLLWQHHNAQVLLRYKNMIDLKILTKFFLRCTYINIIRHMQVSIICHHKHKETIQCKLH